MEVVTQYVFPALCGVAIGIMSGMLGIGGGTVLVPLFRLLFGMSAIGSTATSLFTIIPTSISGAVTHIRNKTLYLKLGLILGLGGACTSPLGVWLASISPSWAVMLVAALVIGYSAINMLYKAAKMKSTTAAPGEPTTVRDAKTLSESETVPRVHLDRRKTVIGIVIGLLAGLLSGYVGVGGGFIMVPFIIAFIGVPMKMASGTSLVAVILLAIPGTIEHAMMGNIDYLAGLIVAVGSIPGAIIGARLVRIIPERMLRFMFGGFLIIAAILLALNEFSVLG